MHLVSEREIDWRSNKAIYRPSSSGSGEITGSSLSPSSPLINRCIQNLSLLAVDKQNICSTPHSTSVPITWYSIGKARNHATTPSNDISLGMMEPEFASWIQFPSGGCTNQSKYGRRRLNEEPSTCGAAGWVFQRNHPRYDNLTIVMRRGNSFSNFRP